MAHRHPLGLTPAESDGADDANFSETNNSTDNYTASLLKQEQATEMVAVTVVLVIDALVLGISLCHKVFTTVYGGL